MSHSSDAAHTVLIPDMGRPDGIGHVFSDFQKGLHERTAAHRIEPIPRGAALSLHDRLKLHAGDR
jgi:hypothetical protein